MNQIIRSRVIKIIAEILEKPVKVVEQLEGEGDLKGFGISSLDTISIITELEDEFGFELTEDQFDERKMSTIEQYIALVEQYMQDTSQQLRSSAWDMIGNEFWILGRETARPNSKDVDTFLSDIPAGASCMIVGASTKYLVERAIQSELNVTVVDFSPCMLEQLKDVLGSQCNYVLYDVTQPVPEYLTKSQDYILSDRLINRFTRDEAMSAYKNMMSMLRENGEVRNSIKLGFYKMDLLLFEKATPQIKNEFFDETSKTINYIKARSILESCITEHGAISKEKLYQWYIGRGKESRYAGQDIETMHKEFGSVIVKQLQSDIDDTTILYFSREASMCRIAGAINYVEEGSIVDDMIRKAQERMVAGNYPYGQPIFYNNVLCNNEISTIHKVNVQSDDKNNQIILKRDKWSDLPLYYRQISNSTQIYSTKINDLLDFNGYAKPELDYDRIWEATCFGKALSNKTIYRNVFCVPSNSEVRLFGSDINIERGESNHSIDIKIGLEQELARSVATCIAGKGRIGLCLSGGLDSYLVARALNEMGYEELSTFSVCVENSTDYISNVKDLGFTAGGAWEKWNHHIIYFDSQEFSNRLKRSVSLYGEPTYMTSLPVYDALLQAVKESGTTVLLSGEGADELFLGYDSYCEIATSQEYLDKWSSNQRISLLNKLAEGSEISSALARFKSLYKSDEEEKALHIRRIELDMSLEPLLQRINQSLLHYGIEGRTPFLCGDVPALAGQYKYDQLIQGDVTKLPLRNMCRRWNSDYSSKKKIPFRSPIQQWFAGDLSNFMKEHLYSFEPLYNEIGIWGVDLIIQKAELGDYDACQIAYYLITLGVILEKDKGKNCEK